jgi:hypothetical protein
MADALDRLPRPVLAAGVAESAAQNGNASDQAPNENEVEIEPGEQNEDTDADSPENR